MVTKTRRNDLIRSLHTKFGGKLSYRQIAKLYKLHPKTIWNIVNRP